MFALPKTYATLIAAFAPVFTTRLWAHVQILVVGGILAPAQRTVASVLRIMGLSGDVHFQHYHRVLHRGIWSSLALSHVLLGLLIRTFVGAGSLVMGLSDRVGAFRTVLRGQSACAPEADGLGPPSVAASTPLAARTQAGCGGR